MPRPTKRDLRKRFLSLYRFIETDLTEENYLDLTWAAARFMQRWRTVHVPVVSREKPPSDRSFIAREKGAARYIGVESDLDLEGARALQARFRQELAAIKRGDTSPAHTTISHLIDSRFDRLKRILTRPPKFVHDKMIGTVRARSMGDLVYVETVERTCIGTGCTETFRVSESSKKRTCSRACAIDAGNIRRKNQQPPPQ